MSRAEPVAYSIDLAERHAHLFAVEAIFPVGQRELTLRLPVWTPGSYLIREYERHIQDLVCDDGEGHALPVTKVDKSGWRVDARGATRVRARYRVYGYDLTVRSAHLDDTHGFWNGACLCLYAEGETARPAHVSVNAPAAWRVTVGLPRLQPNEDVFQAQNYDELVDSPFETGTHELHEWVTQERPHRLAIWGRVETPRQELLADIDKIIGAAVTVFGSPPPYPDYTFILLVSPNAYGGLEHARSCALLASPFTFSPRKKYEEFLELVSHEYFHLWNVKRIHPEALGPFDYQREAYTRSLWVMEGITSYYDRHLLVRAGLQTPKRYLEKLGEELGKVAAIPGRFKQSLEESSFDAWIKLYRPDENSGNSTISYYLKGGVVALLIDLEIRARTENARSLDDVMRLLWRRFGQKGVGFPDAEVQALFEEGAGVSLEALFDRLVRGRGELDPDPILRHVGLRVKPSEDDDDDKQGWLGANLKEGSAGVQVTAVLEGSPGMQHGLYANDEILALDGFRVDLSSLKDRLATRKPGDRIELSLFRRDELRAVNVVLGRRSPDKFEVVPVADPTDREKTLYQAWMGAPLPKDD
jgi:predicted metalloprotease with PDZ domain